MTKRQQKQLVSFVIALIILGIGAIQSHGSLSNVKNAAETKQPGLYSIKHYVDGDTIVVDMNGQSETIRFIGVDTPETHKPNTPVQCYGPAATAYTKNRITAAGGKVRLGSDPYSTNRDRYNRLLRYIYLPDGTLLEQAQLQNGYAFYYPYFPFTKSKDFAGFQATAKQAANGLWGHCTPTPSDGGGYKMDETQAAADAKAT